MQPLLRRRAARRGIRSGAGFTLLEMMAVIMIIGLLGAFLLPNVMDALSGANVSACKVNMQKMYEMITQHRVNNDQAWPKDEGQKFFLRLWKDRTVEQSPKNARRFFCPAAQYGDYLDADAGETIQEYLDNWDGIGPDFTSYAGFTTGGERGLRRQLTINPSKIAILADGHINHRNTIVYMTADGDVHELKISDLIDEGLLSEEDVETGYLPLGPGSPIEVLRTVTNDY